MIKRYGLSKKFRNMVFGDENEEVFLGYSMGQVQSYSDQTAAAIDEEIKYIIDSCYEETKRILLEKKAVVEGLSKRLIEKLTVDGPDFEKIYEADGNLSAVYPQEYSGINTEPDVTTAYEAPETKPEPVAAYEPVETEPAESKPASKPAEDSDDTIDPGPTD